MKKLDSTLKNMILSLTIICIIFGGILAYAYTITLNPIAMAQKAKQEATIKAVLPEFDKLESETINNMPVFKAYKNNKLIGIAIESTNDGYSSKLKVMSGFSPEGILLNHSVLFQAETPGLGTKMETWFKESIKNYDMNKSLLKVKQDSGNIDAITAATISSRAFLGAINKAYETFKQVKQ